MAANKKKVDPHWEIVRSPAPHPQMGWQFHGRRVVGGEITWTTETMRRAVGVERSIVAYIRDTLEAASFEPKRVTLEWVDKKAKTEKAIYVNGVLLPRRVLYVDERGGS